MSVQQALCNSFKRELLEGLHDFTSHAFRLALYDASAALGPGTEEYTASEEVVGAGYVAGGELAPVLDVVLDGSAALVAFGNVEWPGATFTARAGLLYNSSSANRAVAVLNFGVDRAVEDGTFTVQMPPNTAESALIRIL